MPQIAQQDYLYIEIGNLGLDEIGAIISEIWPELERYFKAGALLDVVFRGDSGSFGRVISANVDEDGLAEVYYSMDQTIGVLTRPE